MQDTPRDILQLEALLADPGWRSYEARCRSVMKVWEAQLRSPATSRKENLPDDYIRGRIDALEFALTWPASTVERFRAQADEKRVSERYEQEIDARARYGATFPLDLSQ